MKSFSYISSMKMCLLILFNVQIFPVAALDIEIKWTHCKIISSIFIGRMQSVIKVSAGSGGGVHREVGAGEVEGKA